MVVDTACLPEPASNSASGLSAGSSSGGWPRTTAMGQRAVEGPAALDHVLVLDRVRRRAGSTAARRLSSASSGISSCEVQPVAQQLAAASLVIFLIWWVALRASISGPSVQPLMVLARMTVGCAGLSRSPPCRRRRACGSRGRRGAGCAGRRRRGARPARAAAGRGRRSARGCRRRPRWRSFWNSPSTVVFILLSSTPSTSRASSSSHLRAPDHLDDVPAGAAEGRLELLDDLAVAADRTVEALQVAVDDEDQVVELLAGGQRERAEGLGLVALAVAEEAPHPALAGVVDAAVAAGSG